MPELRSDLAPMSEAVTNHIRVEVLSRYSPENSKPLEDEWVFQYTVRITNQGTETVQLVSRHWIITDALEHTEEVKGSGRGRRAAGPGAGRVLQILVVVPSQDPQGHDARHVSDGPHGRE